VAIVAHHAWPDPTLESYWYDGYGRRVISTAPTGTIQSIYSQGGQLLYQDNGRTGKQTRYYYLSGSLVDEVDYDVASGVYANRYQHTDALGSPVVVTNGPHSVLERNEYEPYGQVLAGGVANRPGFTGHVADAQTGLDYMQQRYYDPMIGRFLSVDPVTATSVGGNFNRYRYGGNNPYRFIDPDGRMSSDVGSRCAKNPKWCTAIIQVHGDFVTSGKGSLSGGSTGQALERNITSTSSSEQKLNAETLPGTINNKPDGLARLVRVWYLSHASVKGGYIVQEITISAHTQDSSGNAVKNFKVTRWEAWSVAPGNSTPTGRADDTFGYGGALPNEASGQISWHGEARFYEGLVLPPTFIVGGEFSELAPSTAVDPHLDTSSATDPVVQDFSTRWP
jgi:RHS repeat-associated protein